LIRKITPKATIRSSGEIVQNSDYISLT